jgi:hypothetical protein
MMRLRSELRKFGIRISIQSSGTNIISSVLKKMPHFHTDCLAGTKIDWIEIRSSELSNSERNSKSYLRVSAVGISIQPTIVKVKASSSFQVIEQLE